MNPYISKLHSHLAAHSNADSSSILTFLCECYMDANPIHSEEIRQIETEFAPFFDKLSFESSNQLFFLIYNLCYQYEHAAFAAGLEIGLRLIFEIDGTDISK